MNNKNYDLILKIIIVGNSAVGKTNILNKYINNKFDEFNKSTIGVEFFSKEIEINDLFIKIQFWDTAGQERFKSINNIYYKNSSAAVIVFDVNDPNNFSHIEYWHNEISKHSDDMNIILFGNKIDIANNNYLNKEEIMLYCEKKGIKLYFVSAKTGENIKQTFHSCYKDLLNLANYKNLVINSKIKTTDKIVINNNNIKKKVCC